MARNFKKRRSNYKKKSSFNRTSARKNRKSSSASELKRFATLLGKVDRGRKNTNSLISEAYERGYAPAEKREKKSLF